LSAAPPPGTKALFHLLGSMAARRDRDGSASPADVSVRRSPPARLRARCSGHPRLRGFKEKDLGEHGTQPSETEPETSGLDENAENERRKPPGAIIAAA